MSANGRKRPWPNGPIPKEQPLLTDVRPIRQAHSNHRKRLHRKPFQAKGCPYGARSQHRPEPAQATPRDPNTSPLGSAGLTLGPKGPML